MKKLISLVCPVYNEAETVQNHYTKLATMADMLKNYDFEFIYTDNHSEDETFSILQEICAKDSRVKAFSFSRNFGYQNSIMTAYKNASGEGAINFDSDLQDPPELLAEMIEKWEMGYKIVYGIREKRKDGKFMTLCRKLFYFIMNKISESHLPPNAGDFMFLDRTILDLLKANNEKCLYLRGLVFGYGFPQIGIPYTREKRLAGRSKFPLGKIFNLALDGVVNQSALPLQYLFYVGVFTSLCVLVAMAATVVAKMFNVFPYPIGTASIILLVMFSISFNAFCLGLLGVYLSRIFMEQKGRPISIIEKKIGGIKTPK